MIPGFAQSLHQRFEQEGIPLLLAGGWAVCHHGYTRLTIDVDWVCPRPRKTEATGLMDVLGFTKTSDGMASRFKYRKDVAFPYVDLIWVDELTFSKMCEPDEGRPGSSPIPTINFRSLLAMKLFALKDDEARAQKDLMDLRHLLKYGHTRIPDAELRLLCDRYAGPGAYDRILHPS